MLLQRNWCCTKLSQCRLQVLIPASRGTTVSMCVSRMATHTIASATEDLCWTQTGKLAHVSLVFAASDCNFNAFFFSPQLDEIRKCSADLRRVVDSFAGFELNRFPVISNKRLLPSCRFRHTCAQGHEWQQICVDTDDSYTCRCHEGYMLDQRTCSPKSSFTSNDLGVEQLPVARSCQGFFPPQDQTPASPGHNCQHICVDNENSHFCTCHEGFVLNADLPHIPAECRLLLPAL